MAQTGSRAGRRDYPAPMAVRDSVGREVGLAVLVVIIAAGAIIAAIAAAGGLPEPTLVDELLGRTGVAGGEARTIRVEGVLRPDGVLAVRHEVRFPDDGAHLVTLERPCPNGQPQPYPCAIDIRIAGQPAIVTERAARSEVSVEGDTAVIEYRLHGAVAGWLDIGVLEWVAVPRDFGGPSGRFAMSGSLTFPSAPNAEAVDPRPHGIGPSPDVQVSGRTLTFAGEGASQILDVALNVAFPVTLVPGLPDIAKRPIPGRAIFETGENIRDQADLATEGVDDALAIPRKVLGIVILAFGFGIPAILWLIVAVTVFRRVRYRGQVVHEGPEYEEAPPSHHDPAIVSLLHTEGRVEPNSVAGAILRLAARNELELQDLAGDAFTVRVMDNALGTTAGESLLVATLRTFAAEEGGRISGPPLFKREVGLWKSFRRDALQRAQREGLIRRAVGLGLIVSAAVLTAVGFGLVYGPLSPGIFFPAAFIVPFVALGFTLRLGYTLSDKGRALRNRWEAYGKHLRDRTGMHDAPPAGVVIWGDQLAYGAVLGVAPKTARMLSPPE